jgi:hypothetical protein
MAERAASAAAVKWLPAPRLPRAAGTRFDQIRYLEAIMERVFARSMMIRLAAGILIAAISVSAIGRAFAQSQLGQIARDGLTNRYEPAQSEIEVSLPLFR